MLYLQADLSIEGCLFFKQTKIHIYNETKIKRKNLAELKASMCVIDFEQQSSFVGGAYGDISDPYTWEDYSMVYKWSNPNGYYRDSRTKEFKIQPIDCQIDKYLVS